MSNLQEAIAKMNSQNNSPASKTPSAPPAKGRKFVFQAPRVPKIGDILQDPEERRKALAEFEAFSTEVRAQVPEFVRNLRIIEDMSEQEFGLYGDTYRQLKAGLAEMLSYDNSAARSVATLAYANAMVATCPTERWAVQDLLDDLIKVGFLTITPASGRGVVRVYSRNYTPANGFARHNAEEVNVILNGIDDLVRRTVEVGKARFEADLTELKSAVGDNPLTITEFKAGKPGRILIEVPDQKSGEKVFKGGWLLLGSNSKQVHVLGSAGAIQRKAEEMVGKIFVYSDQIGAERLHLNAQLPHDLFDLVLILWKWVSMTCKVMEEAEALAIARTKAQELASTDRAELAKKATLTSIEFFLERKIGTVVFDFGNKPFVWRVSSTETSKTVDVPFVMALVERNNVGQIRIADCPDRLKVFFAEHREFEQPGDKFYGLAKLGALLRIGYAMAVAEAKASGITSDSPKDDITPAIAREMGVDPSTLNQGDESDEDRRARLKANKVEPTVATPKKGRRPAHANHVNGQSALQQQPATN